jgi:hypothetical protein
MRRMIPAKNEETAVNIPNGTHHASPPLSFCSRRSNHSAPIGPRGWLACRMTFTASSSVRISPASMALISVKIENPLGLGAR